MFGNKEWRVKGLNLEKRFYQITLSVSDVLYLQRRGSLVTTMTHMPGRWLVRERSPRCSELRVNVRTYEHLNVFCVAISYVHILCLSCCLTVDVVSFVGTECHCVSLVCNSSKVCVCVCGST